MPFALARCAVSWVAGVAVFTSVLMIAFLLTRLLARCSRYPVRYRYPSTNRYQIRRFLDLNHLRLFSHVRDLDPLQHLLDAFIYLAQRLANRAAISLIAFAADCNARGNEQRPINRLDHFERRNRIRVPRQRISAVDAVLRPQQTRFREPLQNLR